MLPPAWMIVLLHFWVGLSLFVISETGLMRIRGPPKMTTPFEGEHLERARTSQLAPIFPKGKPLGFHMVESIRFIQTPPLWLVGPQGVGCTGKSSARKITHLSTILALGSFTSEFPWDAGEGLEFEIPWIVVNKQSELSLESNSVPCSIFLFYNEG